MGSTMAPKSTIFEKIKKRKMRKRRSKKRQLKIMISGSISDAKMSRLK
jgi:hypothetical protein